jgi:hypothetical protein
MGRFTTSAGITHNRVSVSSKTVVLQYNADYVSFGFNPSGAEQPHPKCVDCGEKLANQAMVPSKLKKHLHTKHSHLCEKLTEYFKRLIADQTRHAKQGTKIAIISDKAQEPSYVVAEIVTKKLKSNF